MARWEPKTPQQSLQGSLERIKTQIDQKKHELADLEGQRNQVEQALKALGTQ